MTYVLLNVIIVLQLLILFSILNAKTWIVSNNILIHNALEILKRVNNISVTVLEEQYDAKERR